MAKNKEERREIYKVQLKERRNGFLRITVKEIECRTLGEAMLRWEELVLENERHGITLNKIVELQYYDLNGRCSTLKEKHI